MIACIKDIMKRKGNVHPLASDNLERCGAARGLP